MRLVLSCLVMALRSIGLVRVRHGMHEKMDLNPSVQNSMSLISAERLLQDRAGCMMHLLQSIPGKYQSPVD